MTGCVGETISWLALERLALGELPAARAAEVERHLGECPACRTCLDEVRGDVRALPPLPARPAPAPPWWRRRWPRVGAGLGGLAVAAAILFLVVRVRRPDGEPVAAGRVITKGGDLAVELVRDRGGAISFAPSRFAAGDRFKVVVTCAPGAALHGDVAVFQGAEVSFPLGAATLRCGNRVAVKGAFGLTGRQPATVCLILGPTAPPDRATIRSAGPSDGDDRACLTLDPEP